MGHEATTPGERGWWVLLLDVSRILCGDRRSDPVATISLGAPLPAPSSTRPARVPRTAVRNDLGDQGRPEGLLALARGGVCRAPGVTVRAVRSYRTVSPLPPPKRRRSVLCGTVP